MPLAGSGNDSAAASTTSFDTTNEKAHGRPKLHHRRSSWADIANEWEAYNPATAKDERLRFAQGDAGTTKVGSTRVDRC